MSGPIKIAIFWTRITSFGWLVCFGQIAPVSARIDGTANELPAKPRGAYWTSYNGDYTGRRYSSLPQITTSNASRLRAQWVFHSTSSQRLEATPLLINGVIYVASSNDAFALGTRTRQAPLFFKDC